MIFDSTEIGASREGPGGSILVTAQIGRSGVQTYSRPDGSVVRAYRPPEAVRAADYTLAPVTIGHPVGGVTATTWREHAIGAIASQRDELLQDGHAWAIADVLISDAEAIARVRSRELAECSCAYGVTRDWTAGVTGSGEQYDVIFTDLKPNHVALGPVGFARAGRGAKLLIADSGESEEEHWMAETQTQTSDRDLLVARVAQLEAQNASLIADGEVKTAEIDALTASLKAASAELETVPQQITDGVQSTLRFRERVRPHLAEDYVFDGKSSKQLTVDAIQAIEPDFVADSSLTDTYLDAYLRAAAKHAKPPAKHDHSVDVADAALPAPTDIADYYARASAAAYGGAS